MRIQQVADYGTANPIVARLCIQTRDLLEFYDLSQEQKDSISGLMFSDLTPKLMTCFRIAEELQSEVAEHQQKIDEVGLERQGLRAYTCPSVLDLRSRAETFLYNAKSTLRDFTGVFKIVFGKDFHNQARFDEVVKWARQQFGPDAPLTTALQQDANTWIKKLVMMRNAVEHPGGYSGVLNVENFTCFEEPGRVLVQEPVWYLNSEEKVSIGEEMRVFVANLLTFCEEILIRVIDSLKKPFPIALVEIPESERASECPVRFKMTVDTSRIHLPPVDNQRPVQSSKIEDK